MSQSRVEERASNIAADAKTRAGQFANDARSEIEDMANKTSAAAGQAYDQARDQVRGAAEQVRGAASAVAKSAEQQPGIALLAVGLLCAAAGYWLARR